jgi:hypothetical protein
MESKNTLPLKVGQVVTGLDNIKPLSVNIMRWEMLEVPSPYSQIQTIYRLSWNLIDKKLDKYPKSLYRRVYVEFEWN